MGADRILVHGHRGARARKPENTLPAFQAAIEIVCSGRFCLGVAPTALNHLHFFNPALPYPSKPKSGLPGTPFRAGLPLFRASRFYF